MKLKRDVLCVWRGRWQQAVRRCEQRAVRLHDALRAARGSAALVDELLAWLTEAHALLTAKDRDRVPDDLTVVESLLREHLVRSIYSTVHRTSSVVVTVSRSTHSVSSHGRIRTQSGLMLQQWRRVD